MIVQGAFDCGTNRNSYVSGRLSLVAKCHKMFFESVVVRMDKFGVSFLFILAPSSLPVQSFILFRGLARLTSIVFKSLASKSDNEEQEQLFTSTRRVALSCAHVLSHRVFQ